MHGRPCRVPALNWRWRAKTVAMRCYDDDGVIGERTLAMPLPGGETSPDSSFAQATGIAWDDQVGPLMVLALDPDPLLRAAVASHRGTPAAILHGLRDDPTIMVRCAVAGHPQAPLSVQEWLARDVATEVRVALARNPGLAEVVMAMLVWDGDPQVTYWIARHPDAPEDVLNLLALHEGLPVQLAVAMHPHTPFEACLHLAKTAHPAVRHALTERPMLSAIVRRRLVGDTAPLSS